VTLAGLTMTALTFAATIDRILNGLTRPFFLLGFRPHRPREHDVHRVHAEGIGIFMLTARR